MVTLDQFIALNDELAALVRAGIPLERGLIEAGRDLRGRLGAVSTELGERMGQGMPLPEAISASSREIPEIYRAVVEAGIRSGRLSEALEEMAAIAKGYDEARRAVGMALLYPLIVLGLAYSLTLLFLIQITPRFVETFRSLRLPPIRTMDFLQRAGESAIYWAPIPPVLLSLLVLRWLWTGRASVLDSKGFGPFLNWLPLVGPMVASYRASSFASLLALLLEHRVPLEEAIRLAGESSADRDFRATAARFSQAILQGGTPEPPDGRSRQVFPPLLCWILTVGHRQGNLPEALKQLAQTYRRKARSRADVLKLALPTLCLFGIGVGAVILYALLVFSPMINLWEEMASPVNR